MYFTSLFIFYVSSAPNLKSLLYSNIFFHLDFKNKIQIQIYFICPTMGKFTAQQQQKHTEEKIRDARIKIQQ